MALKHKKYLRSIFFFLYMYKYFLKETSLQDFVYDNWDTSQKKGMRMRTIKF